MNNLVITPGVYEALNSLSKAMRRKILEAVMQYQFEGIEPENLSTTGRVIFRLILACSGQAAETMRNQSDEPQPAEENTDNHEEPAEDTAEEAAPETGEAIEIAAAEPACSSAAEDMVSGLSRTQRRRLRRRIAKPGK